MRADPHVAALPLPAADEVHVHVSSLDLPPHLLVAARAILAPEETARADAFLRAQDRARFAAARSWLRHVLGAYLALAPADLAFAYGPHGKPALAGPEGLLDFNLSHTGGHALLCVSPGLAIGADIEAVRPIEEKVAERFFSGAEVEALAALPQEERTDAFFRCWTRKEAYLKALGSGLATPLDAFAVSLGPDEPARLLEVRGEPGEADAWQIAHLDPGPGLVGAIAARRRGWRPVTMTSAVSSARGSREGP